MTLQDLGNVGEFVAAIATLITLIYIAIQIRQNTNMVRGSTYQQLTANHSALGGQLYRDPELARIFNSGVDGLDSLSEEDRARFQFMVIQFFRTLENLHYQSRKMLIDYEDWEGHRESFFRAVSGTDLEGWWRENFFRFNRHFRAFVDEELRTRAG